MLHVQRCMMPLTLTISMMWRSEVIEGTMELHLKICPTVVRLAKAAAQAHFRAGCNSGPASEAVPYPSANDRFVSPGCLPSSSGAERNGAGLATISGGVHQGAKTSHGAVNASPTSAPKATVGEGPHCNDPAAQASSCSGDEAGDCAAEAEGGAVRGGTGGRRLALGAALAWRLAPAALAQLLAKIEAAHAKVWRDPYCWHMWSLPRCCTSAARRGLHHSEMMPSGVLSIAFSSTNSRTIPGFTAGNTKRRNCVHFVW